MIYFGDCDLPVTAFVCCSEMSVCCLYDLLGEHDLSIAAYLSVSHSKMFVACMICLVNTICL